MNKSLREAIIFIAGLAIGCGSGYVASKKYFERKANKEIEDVKKAFENRINEIEGEKKVAVNTAAAAVSGEIKYAGGIDRKDDIKAQSDIYMNGVMSRASEGYVNYVEYFKKNSAESISIDDIPPDDPPEIDERDDEYGSEELSHSSSYERPGIEVIDESEYGNMVGYESKELYFYASDGVLVDEDEIPVDYPEFFVGNYLEKTGFINNNEKTIYLRNNDKGCDLNVMKIFGTYAN